MTEKDFWQDAFVPKEFQEVPQEHWDTQYEGVLDKNEDTLTGLKNDIYWESKEKEPVSEITPEEVEQLTRRNKRGGIPIS